LRPFKGLKSERVMHHREQLIGTKWIVLRTNNQLKFVSWEFNEFCRVKDIKRHNTVASTPQQNGLVERMKKEPF